MVRRTARAFSIIELMVVMLIIALVVAIVLPALGGARTAAKKTDSASLVAQLTQAIGTFETSEKRLPGPFSVRDLGAASNQTRGMSAMENMLIELLGYEELPSGGNGAVQVGPSNRTQDQRWYNFTKLPEGRSYFPVAGKYLAKQTAGNLGDPDTQQVAVAAHGEIPDLVDAFGAPVLAWPEDDTAPGAPYAGTKEGLADAGQGNQATVLVRDNSQYPAKFYYNVNHCFLQATLLGKDRKNQTAGQGCFLSSTQEKERTQSLAGLLGNPSYAAYSNNDPDRTLWTQIDKIYPTAARGKYVIQSAGPDGLYLSRKASSGNRGVASPSGALHYGYSFMSDGMANASVGYRDSDGKPTTLDLASQFDDIIAAGN